MFLNERIDLEKQERINHKLCLENFPYEKGKEFEFTDSETSHLVGKRGMNEIHPDSRVQGTEAQTLREGGGREPEAKRTASPWRPKRLRVSGDAMVPGSFLDSR